MTAPMTDQTRSKSWKPGGREPVVLLLSNEQSIAGEWLDEAIADPAIELVLAPLDSKTHPDLPPRTLAAITTVRASASGWRAAGFVEA